MGGSFEGHRLTRIERRTVGGAGDRDLVRGEVEGATGVEDRLPLVEELEFLADLIEGKGRDCEAGFPGNALSDRSAWGVLCDVSAETPCRVGALGEALAAAPAGGQGADGPTWGPGCRRFPRVLSCRVTP